MHYFVVSSMVRLSLKLVKPRDYSRRSNVWERAFGRWLGGDCSSLKTCDLESHVQLLLLPDRHQC